VCDTACFNTQPLGSTEKYLTLDIIPLYSSVGYIGFGTGRMDDLTILIAILLLYLWTSITGCIN